MDCEEAFDNRSLRETRESRRTWADAKERRGKYRKSFRRSMQARIRHWRLKLGK